MQIHIILKSLNRLDRCCFLFWNKRKREREKRQKYQFSLWSYLFSQFEKCNIHMTFALNISLIYFFFFFRLYFHAEKTLRGNRRTNCITSFQLNSSVLSFSSLNRIKSLQRKKRKKRERQRWSETKKWKETIALQNDSWKNRSVQSSHGF